MARGGYYHGDEYIPYGSSSKHKYAKKTVYNSGTYNKSRNNHNSSYSNFCERNQLMENQVDLEKKFDYLINNHLDDLCRIFSIAKVSKTYVKNYLKSNYSIHEVINKFERYEW